MQKFIARSDEKALVQSLTVREKEILQLAGRGLSMKGTAQKLEISSGTVRWHLKNAYQKLAASCREEALEKARAMAIIEVESLCPNCACKLERNQQTAVPLHGSAFGV